MPLIYHVAIASDWDVAKKQGYYSHPSLKDEGFIHCSHEHQVAGVLERYFSGKSDIIKLVIDTDKLNSRYVYDWSPSTQDTFPHIYGTINIEAVVDIIEL